MRVLRRELLAVALCAAVATRARAQAPAALRSFPSAQAAADALATAIRNDDDLAVQAMLGSDWQEFVPGRVHDEEEVRAKFVKAWDESHRLMSVGDDKVLVGVGTTGWTLPIPIVRRDGSWWFDVEAGHLEVQARTIGHNELAVVQTLLAIVDAQREYAARDPMKTGSPVYARRLLSSPGAKNGLYWDTQPDEPPSPIGPLLAKAQLGDARVNGYYGYRFRLLYRQGPDAPGGAYEYLVKGRMLGGFAVIAWPVRYGESGVMTFMVGHSGDVYERDLGPDTEREASLIQSFNPDKNWDRADMNP
ncbi:MAG: DUF2950 domain-containing protein [Enhydrobacter sp.]|nr:MAG: DUF2950 domain-containing protein [Enhydrobacter sp.]